MFKFLEKKFKIPNLKGISSRNIEEHLKLYEGYVKNANLISEKISELTTKDAEKHAYEVAELQRRFGFEYNGMINHEYYFEQFEDSSISLSKESVLFKEIAKDFETFEKWLAKFKTIALTRGVGWAMLYFDKSNKILLNAWVDEQHIGQLNNCKTILALDMWEHSYVIDYAPSGKKNYIDDFFANLNWSIVEKRFASVCRDIE
jgi:Fe-Mn family superoxide dismutase